MWKFGYISIGRNALPEELKKLINDLPDLKKAVDDIKEVTDDYQKYTRDEVKARDTETSEMIKKMYDRITDIGSKINVVLERVKK